MPKTSSEQRGNARLSKARVHIGGMGRVGTNIALALEEAGVGEISGNDPQLFEKEQLAVCGFARSSDLGRPKVHVLERYFDGRPGFSFIPIVAPNQSPEIMPYLERADVIVSCANRLDARLFLERQAIRLRRPIVQACVQDGRQALGGLVSMWIPGLSCSCFGCLFPHPNQPIKRGEVLLPTVTKMVAALAATLVAQILSGITFAHENVFALDLLAHRLEPMAISPRRGCGICRRKIVRK